MKTKFIYTDRCQKITKIYDYMYFVCIALLFLIAINNLFIKLVEQATAFNIMHWILIVVSIAGGFLDLYKTKCVSVPSIDFTLEYDKVNYNDPLQKSIVAQAVELTASWANFALSQEKSKIRYYGIYKIIFAVILAFYLIV